MVLGTTEGHPCGWPSGTGRAAAPGAGGVLGLLARGLAGRVLGLGRLGGGLALRSVLLARRRRAAGTFSGLTTVSVTSGSSPSGARSTMTVAPGVSSARRTKSASGSSM